MSISTSFRRPELLPWQKKMGVYVSAVMQELIDSYEIMLQREAYVDSLKSQMVELKKQVQKDVLDEINVRKEGMNPTANFLERKSQREQAVVRLKGTLARWDAKLEDSIDRMRRMSLLWKHAGAHYALQMETYKSDRQRREEKRYMDEKRLIDEQMRKIRYDERQMKEKARKLKEKLAKKSKRKAKEKKKQEKLVKEADFKFNEASFDKNHKLLKDYRKTDVVINPPRKKKLLMGAITGTGDGDNEPTDKEASRKPSEGNEKNGTNDETSKPSAGEESSTGGSALKSAAKGMGLS